MGLESSYHLNINQNSKIKFMMGPLTIEQNGNKIATSGTVNLEWLRYPEIKFDITERNSIQEKI